MAKLVMLLRKEIKDSLTRVTRVTRKGFQGLLMNLLYCFKKAGQQLNNLTEALSL